MSFERSCGETSNAVEDVVSRFGPNERRGLLVGDVDKLVNRALELDDAGVGTAFELPLSEQSKPPLDLVQPRCVGRGEMDMETWPFG